MIRRYKPADFDKVLDLINKWGDRHILGRPERKSDVRVGFVLEDWRGRIMGYTAMSLDSKYSITVIHPRCRKKGYASQLMQAKIDWAREHKLPYLETKVGATNHASIGMLNKLGYVVVGLSTAITGRPVLIMRLTL